MRRELKTAASQDPKWARGGRVLRALRIHPLDVAKPRPQGVFMAPGTRKNHQNVVPGPELAAMPERLERTRPGKQRIPWESNAQTAPRDARDREREAVVVTRQHSHPVGERCRDSGISRWILMVLLESLPRGARGRHAPLALADARPIQCSDGLQSRQVLGAFPKPSLSRQPQRECQQHRKSGTGAHGGGHQAAHRPAERHGSQRQENRKTWKEPVALRPPGHRRSRKRGEERRARDPRRPTAALMPMTQCRRATQSKQQ